MQAMRSCYKTPKKACVVHTKSYTLLQENWMQNYSRWTLFLASFLFIP